MQPNTGIHRTPFTTHEVVHLRKRHVQGGPPKEEGDHKLFQDSPLLQRLDCVPVWTCMSRQQCEPTPMRGLKVYLSQCCDSV